MFGWFNNPEREAKHLNKDSIAILDGIVNVSAAVVARSVAEQTQAAIAEGHEKGRNNPDLYQPILDHYRTMNAEAIQARNQIKMSVFSLTIIYLRAEMIGPKAAPARQVIDAFLESWNHAKEDIVGEA
jgi:hypothetical protein